MTFYKKFMYECKRKGVTKNDALKGIGIAKPAFANWKKNNAVPREETLQKIAEYFEIDPKELYEAKMETILVRKQNSV